MKKNRMSIKIISYILIQAFIALDFCWAGVVASPVDAGTLAPEVALGQADFKALMKIINKKDGSLSALDFGADMNLEDELDSMPDEGELNITTVDNNGSVGSSGSNSNPSLNGNKGNSVNGGDSLIPASSPPPEDLVTYVLVNTEKSIFTVYPSAQDEGEDAMHEITFLEYMKVTGLNEEDIAFVELKVKPIVLKNSNYFQNVQFCSPTVKLQENELQQQARGPFRVKTNSTLQNLIELALAAVTLQNDIKDVVTLMYNALVNLTDDSLEPQRILIKKKEVNVIGILYSMAEYIEKNKTIKLADVYNLATELVGKFEKLGIQFSDIDPNRRKTIGVRPEHVPKLREKFEANPARVELYLRYMMLLHEEGHISLISALAYQLKTIFSETKVKILDAFRALIKEDWPKLFIQLGFMPLSNKDEKRSQADVIIQTLWLLGYHPLRKDLFGVYWTEAIAHYYAYLKIKEQVEYDKLAIEALSLGIHYSLELNPPQLERLGFVLENSVNSFYPFLTSGEREKIIKRIFELQIEENGVFVEKAKIELEQIKGRTPSNLLGKFMNAFGTTILFLLIWAKAGNASNNAFFPNSVMSDWITGGVIIAGAMGLSWLWNKLTWFKSTEQRTVQLVDRAVREYERVKHNVNLIKMEKFYANSSFKDQRVIIDTIRERIRLNPDKINASIFEPFFMNILKFGPKNVLQNPQSSASEQWKIKSPDSLKAPAAAMNSSIKGALKIYNERYFSRHNIDIKAVSFELSRLVLNLTLRNTLHERTVFVKHLQGNAALTKYINADQAEKLYTIIVDEMPVTLKSKDDIMLKIIEKELAKLRGEINAAKAASEITPFLTQIISSLGDTGRTKIILRFMLSSSPALWKSIIEKGQWDGFFTSLNEKLINGVAKQVAFSDSYAVIKREIKRRGLDDIDADEEVYEMFYRAIEAETEGLRFAALSSLEDLSRTESGTNRLVESLEEYLRTEGSNISMDLEKKIIAVVEKLTEEKNKMKAAGINITSEPVRNQDELLPKTVESKRETVIAADTKNATAETAPKIEINKAYLKSMFMNVNMIGYAI